MSPPKDIPPAASLQRRGSDGRCLHAQYARHRGGGRHRTLPRLVESLDEVSASDASDARLRELHRRATPRVVADADLRCRRRS